MCQAVHVLVERRRQPLATRVVAATLALGGALLAPGALACARRIAPDVTLQLGPGSGGGGGDGVRVRPDSPTAADDATETPLGGGFDDWRAIAVPGHTSHMVALHHPASRALYVADAVVTHPHHHHRRRRGTADGAAGTTSTKSTPPLVGATDGVGRRLRHPGLLEARSSFQSCHIHGLSRGALVVYECHTRRTERSLPA